MKLKNTLLVFMKWSTASIAQEKIEKTIFHFKALSMTVLITIFIESLFYQESMLMNLDGTFCQFLSFLIGLACCSS